MRETKRTSKDILKDMLSGDMQKIWNASCEIVSLSQNHEKIMDAVYLLFVCRHDVGTNRKLDGRRQLRHIMVGR